MKGKIVEKIFYIQKLWTIAKPLLARLGEMEGGGGGDGLLVQGWGFKCQLANVMLRVRVGVKGASGLVVVVSD